MGELAAPLLVIAAVMAVTALAANRIGPVLRLVERLLVGASALVILFIMCLVGAEVVMRYGFNSPIPGQLEGSELLMPVIVFFGISYTQATHGHVGMDLVLDSLRPRARRYASIAGLLASVFICSVLAWFSFRNALQLWKFDDVTMSQPYFHTWPAAAAIPLGYGLVSLRLFLQALHLANPRRYAEYAPAGRHFQRPD